MYDENSLPEICSLAVLRRFRNHPCFACFNSRLIQDGFGPEEDDEQSRAYAHLLYVFFTFSAVQSCAATMYM